MAIYKPSNLGPNLEEIDVTLTIPSGWGNPNINQSTLDTRWQSNIFEAQVNTTGENVLGYKMNILENNTENVIYDSGYIGLPKKESNRFGKPGVKNKDFVKTYFMNSEEYDTQKSFIVNNKLTSSLRNGKDYQWNMRMYDAVEGSTAQPITKVCDGFLVGSTHYVIWVNNPTDAVNDLLLYDRYVEFVPDTSNVFPIIEKDSDVTWPPTSKEIERVQIDWVEKNLGNNKNITKIELVDGLQYNYRNGATFKVYLCDNKHTLNSAYADPNSLIDVSMFMARYSSQAGASGAPAEYDPGTATSNIKPAGAIDFRRIIGTSTITGELRVQEPFTSVPTNGEYYALYQLDRVTNKYKKVDGQDYSKQKIGGTSQGTATVMSNVWNNTTKRLFIQPNINIKSDATNPNEIVFDVNGVRVDILQYINSQKKDWTFNKLDNTQWLLENESGITRMSAVTSTGTAITAPTSETSPPTANTNQVPIIPGSIYTVYTDFMDSVPNGVFYARKTPTVTMMYHNWNGDESEVYENINSSNPSNVRYAVPWRDIEFKAEWTSINNVQIKYYRYTLYDHNGVKVTESNDMYDTDLYWAFRGFQTGRYNQPEQYTIELLIVDELNKEFVQSKTFGVYYETERPEAGLDVKYDCDKQAFKITAETPLYAIQPVKAPENEKNVNLGNINKNDVLNIPNNKRLLYNTALSAGYPNIMLTKPFTYLTQFRLTKDFINSIPAGGEKIVTEVAVQKDPNDKSAGYDKYTLTLSSLVNFFVDAEKDVVVKNTNRLKMKWYKNDGTQLNCFDDGTTNEFDVIKNDPASDIMIPDELTYCVQPANLQNTYGYCYAIVESLPKEGVDNTRYILSKDYVFNGHNYIKGSVFIYETLLDDSGNITGYQWKQIQGKEFIFAEFIEQVPGYTMESFEVPYECIYRSSLHPEWVGRMLLWTEAGFNWLDDFNVSADMAIQAITSKWFMVYLVVDNDSDGNERVRSYIQMNNERVVK